MLRVILCLFILGMAQVFPKSAPLQKLTVSLGYQLDPCQGPIIYARETGIFKKHGLEVELVPASGGEESSRAVAIGKADIGITKLANHIVRVASGMPLVRISTLIGKPLEVFISKNEIKSAEDLRGKTIGYATSHPAFTQCVIEKALAKFGLKKSDVTLVAFQKGLAQAFVTGGIDAAFTATDPHETVICRQKGIPYFTKSYSEFGIPPFEQFIFFTHRKNTGNELISRFNAALKEAIMEVKTKPAEAWQIICAAHPEMDSKTNYHIWINLIGYFEAETVRVNFEAYQALIDFMNEEKVSGKPLLKKKVDLADILPSSV